MSNAKKNARQQKLQEQQQQQKEEEERSVDILQKSYIPRPISGFRSHERSILK